MNNDDRQMAARLLGMKPAEIISVEDDPATDVVVVTTHDGVRVRITAEGAIAPDQTPPAVPAPDQTDTGDGGGADAIDGDIGTTGGAGEPAPVGVKHKMADVLAWVEADPDQVASRAAIALAAELAGPENERRPSLITKLEPLAAQ